MEVCMEHVIVCQHLVLMTWPDIKAPAVGRLASLLQQFQENLPPAHPRASAEERLSQQFQLFRVRVFLLLPTSRHLGWQGSCFLLRGEGTMCTFVCHPVLCLHYYEESMRQWDVSHVEAGVCELWGIQWLKSTHTGELPLWLLLSSSPDGAEGLILPLTPA